jgi:hypothetical protein
MIRAPGRHTPRRQLRHLTQAQRSKQPVVTGRPFAISALASAMALAMGGTAQAAIKVIVNNTNDSGDGSLRQAILKVNAAPGGDFIDFNLSSTPATIYLSTGELAITDDVTIFGPGADQLEIDAGGESRLFDLNGSSKDSIDVSVSGLTLTNGKADWGGAIRSISTNLTLTDITISGNTAGGSMCEDNSVCSFGGGIHHYGSSLTVFDSTITGNTAGISGAGTNGFVKGGGIHKDGGGTLTITDVTIHGNTATNSATVDLDLSVFGGGIHQDSGTLTVTGSIITGNTAGISGAGTNGFVKGGGIHKVGVGTVTITDVTIHGNTANNNATVELDLSAFGGGIHQDSGTLTVTGTTISGNTAGISGTGLNGFIKGGGIHNAGATATIDNTTISGNTATNEATLDIDLSCFGGGIHQDSGTLTVTGSTISGNTATNGSGLDELSGHCHAGGISLATNDSVTFTNSIVSDNNAEGILRLSEDRLVNDLIIESSTIVGDIASDHAVMFHNAIVTGTLPNRDGPSFPGPGNGTVFATYSLIQQPPLSGVDDSAAKGTNLLGADPMLGDLMPNGGPTETHALLAGSPAINSADPFDFPDTDQRGVQRPQGLGADMGAFEVSVGNGALVAFFDEAVAEGTLVGSGNGRSADGRRGALRNMLLATDDFIAEGDDAEACTQLLDAYERTDGEFRPPDFVAGEAADDLAVEIAATYTALNCD